MKRLLLFCLLLFVLQPDHSLAAEDSKISVKAEINRASITIGDPIEYKITLRHDPSVQVLSTIPVPPADVFKVKKVQDIKGREGEKILEGKKFTLTAFQLGEFVLDPVKIEYRIGSGQPESIETEKIYLSV